MQWRMMRNGKEKREENDKKKIMEKGILCLRISYIPKKIFYKDLVCSLT